MNILHPKSIVVLDLQLPENGVEIYQKNPSRSLKNGFTITAIMLIQAMGKKLRWHGKQTLPSCRSVIGSLMLDDVSCLK
jgi:hypothetical protein